MFRLKGQFTPSIPVRGLKFTDDFIQISPSLSRYITLSGTYNGTIELKTHNRLPAVQSTYAQGRSSDGSLIWRGPETGELFSYGPAVASLEFDGSSYPYDQSGKLVHVGTGNGKAAAVYQENIFRPALLHSHQLKLESALYRYGKRTWNFNLKLAHGNEQNVIRENNSFFNSLSTDMDTRIKWLTIKGAYLYNHDERTTHNRNGLLNIAYQNALLTPVTFSNDQGTTLGDGQRSYSNKADNPWFLLRDNNNHYHQTEHNGGLTLTLRSYKWEAGIVQSINHIQQQHTERYRPGTTGWPAGMYTDRNKSDLHYLIQSNVGRDIAYNGYHFKSKVQLYHTYGNVQSRIRYQPNDEHYNYQRSSHDLLLNISNTYTKRDLIVKLVAGNKAYISNTATKNNLFLPAVDLELKLNNLPNDLYLNLSSSYHIVNSELPIDKSLAYTNLLQYTAAQSFAYRPIKEVSGYGQLAPVRSREWDGGFTLGFRQILALTGNIYIKNIHDDVFPTYENGSLQLKNMADLQSKGIELGLELNNAYISKSLSTSATASFYAYRTTVTGVREGYNFTPIAGFSNVYKTIAEGQPLGVIVGNAYLRDAADNIVIGEDGFPLVNATPKVIGNTIPDFVVKLNNSVYWNNLTLQTSLEWKKGGQTWNGTQAALDYYGRSKTTEAERNVSGYVFKGVKQDGHINDIPVAFFDPSLPVEANRWTRYGLTGIAEEYVQKADYLRLNTINLSYRFILKKRKQQINLTTYVHNILLWSPYKGADPGQSFYDQPNGAGLDFFNLPAVKTYGFNVTYQF
jgi:hypothetical protein